MKRSIVFLLVAICALAARHAFANWTWRNGTEGETTDWSDAANWNDDETTGTEWRFNYLSPSTCTVTFSNAVEVATGTLHIQGGSAVAFAASGDAGLGFTNAVNVGSYANGYLTIEGGTFNFGTRLNIATVANAQDCDFTMAGGTVSIGEQWGNSIVIAGNEASCGCLTVSNGTLSACGNLIIGHYGTGVVHMVGGTLTTTGANYWGRQLNLAAKTNSCAEVNLDGGRLEIAYVKVGESRDQTEAVSTATINFNGGTLAANNGTTAFIPDTAGLSLNILSGGAVIDTGSYDITIVPEMTGTENDGGLKKYGSGKLTVTAGKKWNGPTKVYEGTLDMNNTELGGDIYIAPGASIINATYSSDANVLWYDPKGTTVGDTTLSLIADAGATYDDYSVSSLAATGGTVVVQNALDSLLCSAAVWYDPSDSSTLTTDDASVVSAISNKGLAGSSMDGTAYGATLPYIGDDGYLNFTNCLGFVSTGSLYYSQDAGRALFAVASRFDNGDTGAKDIQIFPMSWADSSTSKRYLAMECWDWTCQNYYLTAGAGDDANTALGPVVEERVYLRSTVASSGTLSLSNIAYYDNAVVTNSASAEYGSLTNGVSSAVYYGMRRLWSTTSTGKLGEALAFDRGLSATETAVINQYLAAKWLEGGTAKPDVGTTTVEELTLSNGAIVDFDGAAVSLGSVAGYGVVTNASSIAVTGTVLVDVTNGVSDSVPEFAVDDLDLSAATLSVTGVKSIPKGEYVTVLRFKPGSLTAKYGSVECDADGYVALYDSTNGTISVGRCPGMRIIIR